MSSCSKCTQNKIYQTSCVFRIKTCRGTTDEYVFSYGGNASHLRRKGPRHRALRLGASAPHWVPGSTQEHSFRQAMIYNSGFQPFSSHITHKLIHRILPCRTPKSVLFADLTKQNRCNFDSFTPRNYCCVGCCHFFI